MRFLVGDTVQAAADRVAAEIVGLLKRTVVRDRVTGIHREARPADIAILFRSRDSHRDFEAALDRRGVATYVYKGLGFFDADEIQDAVALLRYLADPLPILRAATLLRSRLVRLSDQRRRYAWLGRGGRDSRRRASGGRSIVLADEDRACLDRLRGVGAAVAGVRRSPDAVGSARRCPARDRVCVRASRITPAAGAGEPEEAARHDPAGAEPRLRDAGRIADHLERLAVGDESNAAIDAIDAVSLMTVHAAKGLEFPIVFVVNMGRGTGGIRGADSGQRRCGGRGVGGDRGLPVGSGRRRAGARARGDRSACSTSR